MTVDERWATILPAPNSAGITPRHSAASLRVLAAELRAGLVALAKGEPTWERGWRYGQAAKVAGYIERELRGHE